MTKLDQKWNPQSRDTELFSLLLFFFIRKGKLFKATAVCSEDHARLSEPMMVAEDVTDKDGAEVQVTMLMPAM